MTSHAQWCETHVCRYHPKDGEKLSKHGGDMYRQIRKAARAKQRRGRELSEVNTDRYRMPWLGKEIPLMTFIDDIHAPRRHVAVTEFVNG